MPGSAHSGALVVGESLVDVTRAGNETFAYTGGSPLNVAVGMARLGVPTTLATQIGRDAYGELIRSHLAASAVALIELGPAGATGTATAQLAADGSAAYTFDLRWDPVPTALPGGFGLLHVGSAGATLAPGADTVAALVRDARRAGSAVSLDPNLRPALTPDLAQVRRRMLDLVALADVVKLSDEDAEGLLPGRSLDGVLDDLLAIGGPRLVVLTRGGAGAVLATTSARVGVPAPPVEVVDTIGAGDSFMAALLAALGERGYGRSGLGPDDLEKAGAFACQAAAITCSRPGADPPWRSELALLAEPAGPPEDSYTGR